MQILKLLVLVALLVAQAPDPDYVGPEDPAHQGQPMSCSNSERIKAVKTDCPCEKKTAAACDPKHPMEDARCYVYCRKPACRCRHKACETE